VGGRGSTRASSAHTINTGATSGIQSVGPSGKDVVSMPRTRPPYPELFRREAVELVRKSGRPVKEIALAMLSLGGLCPPLPAEGA
jgi:hypothetical protein